jgi:enoyl-CoA hydratase
VSEDGYRLIRVERAGAVAEVVLDNPGRLNAMTPDFFHEIRRAFEELDAAPDVHVVIVWAQGRVFSSGLDLTAAVGLIPGAAESPSDAARNRILYRTIVDFQSCFTQVRKCRKPVIAAVHGICIGGGLDLATACDIRLCASDAAFSIHETKMAMVADLGTLQRVSRICGRGFVREMAFTGAPVSAQRALEFGLVTQVHPGKPQLLEAARALAAEIAANSPLAIQGIKKVLDFSESHSEEDGLEFVAQWNTSFFLSRDLFEALDAFTAKREPRFTGE